jgi:branched-chain amino acid transport system ATP-binding protein
VLKVRSLTVAYGHLPVLRGVSFRVQPGEIVALLGSNGAGKSTTLKAVQGLVVPVSGEVLFLGKSIHRLQPHEVVRLELCLVPEERFLFPDMTVLENLLLGAYPSRARSRSRESLVRVYGLFPVLRHRYSQKVRTLSGGEQQMVTIGRALMAQPKLLMLDEPSLGLAPLVAAEVFRTIALINAEGITILLVEQNVTEALRLAERGYVLEGGSVAGTGPARDLLDNPGLGRAFLGMG